MVRFSTRSDGDFHLDQDRVTLDARRRAFVDLPWSQPDEVHGTHVGVVAHPADRDGLVADALVTDCVRAVVGIWVGDCAPVALVSASGRVGGVHAGWRGLRDGVVANAVAAMRREPHEQVSATLGPCIHACCYELGDADLATMTSRFGSGVAATTSSGRPSLDMPAAISAALAELGVALRDESECTAHHADTYFSHRARAERERMVMAVWKP
jgi:YfiH family protein